MITAGRVLLISLPTVGTRATSHTSPRTAPNFADVLLEKSRSAPSADTLRQVNTQAAGHPLPQGERGRVGRAKPVPSKAWSGARFLTNGFPVLRE